MKFRVIATALVVLAGWLLTATPHAQSSHPCDTTPSAGQLRPTDSIGFGFCHTQKDRAGNSTADTALRTARVVIDGTERFNGPVAPQGTPNAFGLIYFETPKTIQLAAGTHTVQLTVANGVTTDWSDAGTYTLTISPALTKAASPQRIRAVSEE